MCERIRRGLGNWKPARSWETTCRGAAAWERAAADIAIAYRPHPLKSFFRLGVLATAVKLEEPGLAFVTHRSRWPWFRTNTLG